MLKITDAVLDSKENRIYEKLLLYNHLEFERERIKMGDCPQILKDKFSLGDMFLKRYGSSRKLKSKKLIIREWSLSGETGSCRLESMGFSLISFLHVLFLMGKVMKWA